MTLAEFGNRHLNYATQGALESEHEVRYSPHLLKIRKHFIQSIEIIRKDEKLNQRFFNEDPKYVIDEEKQEVTCQWVHIETDVIGTAFVTAHLDQLSRGRLVLQFGSRVGSLSDRHLSWGKIYHEQPMKMSDVDNANSRTELAYDFVRHMEYPQEDYKDAAVIISRLKQKQ